MKINLHSFAVSIYNAANALGTFYMITRHDICWLP